MKSIVANQTQYKDKALSNASLMLYGHGDGGVRHPMLASHTTIPLSVPRSVWLTCLSAQGGPQMEHLERLLRLQHTPGVTSRVQLASPHEFFVSLERDAARFNRWSGELFLEAHRGTYTTQAVLKRLNRVCERMLREVEWLSVLACCLQPSASASLHKKHHTDGKASKDIKGATTHPLRFLDLLLAHVCVFFRERVGRLSCSRD